jgi:hypothetical protein
MDFNFHTTITCIYLLKQSANGVHIWPQAQSSL